MRPHSEVARRYAAALFELEQGEKIQQAIDELKALESALAKNKEIHDFFMNPVISRDEKKLVLQDLEPQFATTFRFIQVLVEGDRIAALREIIVQLEKMLREYSNEIDVELKTAHALGEKSLQEIKVSLESLWKKTVRLNASVHPEILGGFIAQAPGRTVDASAVAQLENLRQQIVG